MDFDRLRGRIELNSVGHDSDHPVCECDCGCRLWTGGMRADACYGQIKDGGWKFNAHHAAP